MYKNGTTNPWNDYVLESSAKRIKIRCKMDFDVLIIEPFPRFNIVIMPKQMIKAASKVYCSAPEKNNVLVGNVGPEAQIIKRPVVCEEA